MTFFPTVLLYEGYFVAMQFLHLTGGIYFLFSLTLLDGSYRAHPFFAKIIILKGLEGSYFPFRLIFEESKAIVQTFCYKARFFPSKISVFKHLE